MTPTEIVAALGGPTAIARPLGIRPDTVCRWRNRGGIPCEYWAGLVELAKAKRVTSVTLEMLAQHRTKPPRGGRRVRAEAA
jgi:hypothetical protein